jgi:hypothetical protein
MALDKISQTVQQFRQDVLGRGGPQISSMYEVTLAHIAQEPIVCYPLNVILPGRQFVYYEHDLWGPVRKIPYKRGYTQCHMSFVVYQDWAERTYIESWMNSIILNDNVPGVNFDANSVTARPQTFVADAVREQEAQDAFNNALATGGPASSDANFGFNYQDYIDYTNGFGTVLINCLNSQTKEPNVTIMLKEAFPAAISQMSMASDGTSYPTFNVTFQFNDYHYL